MAEFKRIRTSKVWESFTELKTKKCGCVQCKQGGTFLSRQHNLHVGAFIKETSRRMSRRESLKEGLTAEQRLHLFDHKDTKDTKEF